MLGPSPCHTTASGASTVTSDVQVVDRVRVTRRRQGRPLHWQRLGSSVPYHHLNDMSEGAHTQRRFERYTAACFKSPVFQLDDCNIARGKVT